MAAAESADDDVKTSPSSYGSAGDADDGQISPRMLPPQAKRSETPAGLRHTALTKDVSTAHFIAHEKERHPHRSVEEIHERAHMRHTRKLEMKVHELASQRPRRRSSSGVRPARHALERIVEGDAHGTTSLAVLSGVTCGVLMFVFCVVFGYIIFEDKRLQEHAEVMVGLNLLTAFVAGAMTVSGSGCRVAIAGPDVNPSVFLGLAASIVVNRIPESKPEAVLPTVLLTIVFGTALVALTFFLLGYFRAARIASFVPPSVLRGFLASVGWKVIAAAVTVATGLKLDVAHAHDLFGTWRSWRLLLPAIPVGVFLYVSKRRHIGRTTVVLPVMLLGPLALFYVVLASAGISFEEARAGGWMYPEAPFGNPGHGWEFLEGRPTHIDMGAFGAGAVELIAMDVIVVLDFLLQFAGTESQLGLDLDLNYELLLAAKYNAVSVLCTGVPSYALMKFNVLNYSISNSTQNRTAGVITFVLCGLLWLSGLPVINVLPRFLLGGLLIYAGLGFLVENLYDARQSMSKKELFAVWFIFGVAVVTKDLLIAVVVGAFIAAVIFVWQYARQLSIDMTPGNELRSLVVRPMVHAQKLEQLGERLFFAMRLHGMLFWGSASKIQECLEERFALDRTLPPFKRTRWLILDCEHVTGMDASVPLVFGKLSRLATTNKLELVWTGLLPKLRRRLATEGVLVENQSSVFSTFDDAVEYVEEEVLHYSNVMRSKWLIFPSLRKLNAMVTFRSLHSPWTRVIRKLGASAWTYFKHEVIDPDTHEERAMDRAMSDFAIISPMFRSKTPAAASSRRLSILMDGDEDDGYDEDDEDDDEDEDALTTTTGSRMSDVDEEKGDRRPLTEMSALPQQKQKPKKKKKKGSGRKRPGRHVLYEVGDQHDTLYILESGRVSSYLEHADGSRSRIASQMQGVFLGSVLGMPCSETVEVDVSSTFFVITKAKLDQMEAEKPRLALQFKNMVLRDVLSARNRLERSLDAEHHHEYWDSYTRFMKEREGDIYKQSALISKFAQSVAQEVSFLTTKVLPPLSPTPLSPGGVASVASHPSSAAPFESDDHLPDVAEIRRAISNTLRHVPSVRRDTMTPPTSPLLVEMPPTPPDAPPSSPDPKKRIVPNTLVDGARSLPAPLPKKWRSATHLGVLEEDVKDEEEEEEDETETETEEEARNVSASPASGAPPPPPPPLKTLSIATSMNQSPTPPVPSRLRRRSISLHDLRSSRVFRRHRMLNRSQRRECTAYFHIHATRSNHVPPRMRLSTRHLRHILMDLGVYATQGEIESILEKEKLGEFLSLDQFLHLMGHVMMAEITPSQMKSFELVFSLYDSDNSGGLSAGQINELMRATLGQQLSADDMEALVDEWEEQSPGELVFEEFLSMLAFALKRDELDRNVNEAFLKFSGAWESEDVAALAASPRDRVQTERISGVTARRLHRVLQGAFPESNVTREECDEMLWEADVAGRGTLSFREFIELVSVVYEPGWILLWNWRLRSSRRIFHNLVVEGEFDEVEDVTVGQVRVARGTPMMGPQRAGNRHLVLNMPEI